MSEIKIITGDALEELRKMPDDSVDLVFTSPPYEDARFYGIDFRLKGQDWVDWLVPIYLECARVCRGLVAVVVEGRTSKFRWSATPALLMADLHRAGVKLRKPPIYSRQGIPGSGGPDWWRNDYEFVVCSSKGKLPWSDNLAMGKPTKYEEGGACTNRLPDGKRIGYVSISEINEKGKHRAERLAGRKYAKPKSGIANPGNVISGPVGKGHMGSDLCHETEAPFPEWLATPFVKSFCPPDGIVLDPFMGSGTTLAVAKKEGRCAIGIDIRESQKELAKRRIREDSPLFAGVL